MIVQADSENANRFLNSITRRFLFDSFCLAGQKNYTCAHTLQEHGMGLLGTLSRYLYVNTVEKNNKRK